MKNRMILGLLILSVVVIFAASAVAQDTSGDKVVCPVSGEEITKAEAKGSTEYKGETYFFCCENCEKSFLENPDKYINSKPGEHHSMEGEADCACGTEDKDATAKVKDPVCGMEIEKSKAAATAEYNGQTYYFCMAGCKDKFLKEPGKYVTNGDEKVTCPVMGNEIAKKDSAGSSEYQGKTYYFCCGGCKTKFDKNPEKYVK